MTPRLFELDSGPAGPWQSARCAEEGCTHISWTGLYCELCRPRHEYDVLPSDVAQWIGPSNAARQKEERGPQ